MSVKEKYSKIMRFFFFFVWMYIVVVPVVRGGVQARVPVLLNDYLPHTAHYTLHTRAPPWR